MLPTLSFIWSAAAANAPDVQSLTLSPGISSVANTLQKIFLGQGNDLELENSPFSFNQDYDKCFSRESGDRYRASHKENCPFFFSPPPLPVSLWISAGDTREGEKRSNLVGDRWSFEGWLTDSISYCYSLLWCLPSSSDKRGKGVEGGMRDEGWGMGNCNLSILIEIHSLGLWGQSRQWHRLLLRGARRGVERDEAWWKWTTLFQALETDKSDSTAPTRMSQIPFRQVSGSLSHFLL